MQFIKINNIFIKVIISSYNNVQYVSVIEKHTNTNSSVTHVLYCFSSINNQITINRSH